ncbi:hypothetical protein [Reyranella sp.]|uniref:hypothetical protein n=1 Tax=Reyranella sp. TaxID=1929291 RepID=UPI003BAB1BFB
MRPIFALAALLATLSSLFAAPVRAGDPSDESGMGWQLERDVDLPSYAFIEPAYTDLAIDVLVLSCEQAGQKVGLQVRLYPLEPGPLRTAHGQRVELASAAEFDIDGRRLKVSLLFADAFVVVADAAEGAVPLLSDSLIAALETGKQLTMRLQPVEPSMHTRSGSALQIVANLQAGLGETAVSTLRRCGVRNDVVAAR